jgi:hypothetical protein
MPHRLRCHLGVGVGAVAAGKQALLAEPTLPTTDGEGHDDPVTNLEVRNLGSQFDHLAHVFMSEDVSTLHGRLVPVKEMKVGATDGAGRDLDNRVARMLDRGIGNRVYPNVAFSVPAKCAHDCFLQIPAPTGEIVKRSYCS